MEPPKVQLSPHLAEDHSLPQVPELKEAQGEPALSFPKQLLSDCRAMDVLSRTPRTNDHSYKHLRTGNQESS